MTTRWRNLAVFGPPLIVLTLSALSALSGCNAASARHRRGVRTES